MVLVVVVMVVVVMVVVETNFCAQFQSELNQMEQYGPIVAIL